MAGISRRILGRKPVRKWLFRYRYQSLNASWLSSPSNENFRTRIRHRPSLKLHIRRPCSILCLDVISQQYKGQHQFNLIHGKESPRTVDVSAEPRVRIPSVISMPEYQVVCTCVDKMVPCIFPLSLTHLTKSEA